VVNEPDRNRSEQRAGPFAALRFRVETPRLRHKVLAGLISAGGPVVLGALNRLAALLGTDGDWLWFTYTIEGDNPPWRPLHALDDGCKVYIEFPRGIAQGEMPPLFIISPDGKTSELVNYRVRNSHMIVDRLFAAAELRHGDKGSECRVRIVRNDGRLAW
jgi:type IV secretory pathway VirB9-like protein